MVDTKAQRTARKHTIRQIWRYIRRYRLLLIFSILLAAGVVALTLWLPLLLGQAIDQMIGAGQVQFAVIGRLLVQGAVIIGITALLQWVMNTIHNAITYRVIRDMRRDAFHRLQKMPLSYLDTHPAGEIVSRIIADVDQFAEGLLLGFTQLFTGIATMIGTLLFMLFIHPGITAVVVILTPLSLLIASFIARRTFAMFREQSAARGEQTAIIDEMINGQKAVQAFSREEDACRQFQEVNERLRSCTLQAMFFSSLPNPTTRFINSLIYAGVGLAGALSAISGDLTVGGLSCFLNYAGQYAKPFNDISGVVAEVQNAIACAARFFELLEQPLQSADGTAALPAPIKGQVDMMDVSFSYTPDKPILQHIDLHVQPGQRIAIVGPTGCGKTTLINLLMRFYEPDSGRIFMDGQDITAVPRQEWRSAYGMVLQDTWLKSGTVRENLLFGNPQASEEDMIAAAKAAHAHGFIRRLPHDYDTVLTADGGGLSAGQKQLLCIARVMLSKPPVLLLDEATSSIDPRTELKVQAAFDTLMEGRTSFVVAHRLSTIRQADVILVIQDGRIIEQGRHEALLAQDGFYAHLYNSQFAR